MTFEFKPINKENILAAVKIIDNELWIRAKLIKTKNGPMLVFNAVEVKDSEGKKKYYNQAGLVEKSKWKEFQIKAMEEAKRQGVL